MEIDQIRYFLAICDKGNFTRAAQTCGIKQPSLTNAIHRLERSIGGKLFERSSPPVRLTKLGSQLLPICKEINELWETTHALAKGFQADAIQIRVMTNDATPSTQSARY